MPIWLTEGSLGADSEQSRTQNSERGEKSPVLWGSLGGAASPRLPAGLGCPLFAKHGEEWAQARGSPKALPGSAPGLGPILTGNRCHRPWLEWQRHESCSSFDFVLLLRVTIHSWGTTARGASSLLLTGITIIPYYILSSGCPIDTFRAVFPGMQ